MTVFEFEEMLGAHCAMFRTLRNFRNKKKYAMFLLERCTNNFEEACVVERLKEENERH